MRIVLLFVFICSLQWSLQAQKAWLKGKTTIPVKGIILDNNTREPLNYATVSFFQQVDSSLVTGSLTDEQGRFKLTLPVGIYYAVVEFISYQPLLVPNILIDKKSKEINLGTLNLTLDVASLALVNVRAEQSEFRLTLDKKVFTVGKNLTSIGSNAAQVLDNIPTITVSPDGEVNLRGSQGVKIWIDGKPSGLMSSDVRAGLESIPANIIDRVELVTNPSARYDAESVAGIINIILKKERRKGLNGNVNINGGFPTAYGTSLNLNWRRPKLNLFTNLSYQVNDRPREARLYQERLIRDTLFLTNQIQDLQRRSFTLYSSFGLDYFLNKNNTLTTSFSSNFNEIDIQSRLDYDDYLFEINRPLAQSFRNMDQSIDRQIREYKLTYIKSFSQINKELTFDINYLETDFNSLADLFESPSVIDHRPDSFMQFSHDDRVEQQLIAQIDFVQPVGEKGRFESGLRTSIREIENKFFVDELVDGDLVRLDEISNDFRYEEYIYAGYALFSNSWKKLSYQIGLRMEVSDVSTLSVESDSLDDRTYTNLFPSTAVTYQLSPSHSFQLSYSRRLKRPSFDLLRPFISYSDRRNISAGNPNLDPEYANSLELSYLRYWEKASLTSAIFYRHASDFIDRIRVLDSEGTFIARPENLGFQDAFGVEFVYSIKPFAWWSVSGDVNLYYAALDGGSFGEDFNAKTFSAFGRISSNFKLWKKLRIQLRYNHRAARNGSQGRNKALYGMDAALSYPVFKQKGRLSLNGQNVLNTHQWEWTNSGPNFYNEGIYIFNVPSVRLAFSYQINKNVSRKRIGNKSSAEYGNSESY